MNLVKSADFKINGKHFEIIAVWKFNGKITTVEFIEIINPDKTFEMPIEQFMEKWNQKENRVPVIIVPTTYFTSYEDFSKLGVSLIIWASMKY